MKKTLFTLSLLGISCWGFAQQPDLQKQKTNVVIPGTNTENSPKGNGKITGTIQDVNSKEFVEFATVALVNKATNKAIDGTSTNEKGYFAITKVAEGSYQIVISFVGYQNKTIDNITVPSGRGDISLGNILIQQNENLLKEITITEEKELIEDKVDRIVYNADKDLTNAGGTAADVLRKVPMLAVDIDGNVQLRGSSNIRVLINNKPSTIMASSVADALRQIPADMIKSVEVITSPSAKYDAEGTAGIINIITKKNNLQGLSGNVNAGGGTRASNLFSNINLRQKKLGFGFNVGTNLWYNHFKGYTNRENFVPDISYLNQTQSGRNFGMWGNSQFTMDYEMNPKNSLSSSIRFSRHQFDNSNLLGTVFSDLNQTVIQQFDRDIDNKNRNNTLDLNLDYTRTFKKQNQELSFLALYSRNFANSNYNLDQQDVNGITDYREKNENANYNEEITFQTDYVHPITTLATFEIGAKAILRHVNSDFQLYTFQDTDFVQIPERSNVFNYDQDVLSSYTTFGYTTKKKFGVKAGLRYEHTQIVGDFVSTDTRFTQDYNNLIPSLVISQDFKKGQKLKLSYSRRIQRPSIFYLNPYVNYSDAKNISFGNPNLNPELTNSYELSYNAFTKTTSGTIALYWRQSNNAISSVRTVDDQGIVTTTFDNIANNDTYGVSFFGSKQITKKARIGGNANFYYVSFESPNYQTNNANFAYNFNFNFSYNFEKGFSFQGFGFINSPRVELQGRQGAFSFYTLGLRKELFKKKGGITLGIDNPFARALKIKSDFETEAFTSENVRNVYNRAFRLSFNYQFGKMNFTDKPKRKKINNDDMKQGENNNQN